MLAETPQYHAGRRERLSLSLNSSVQESACGPEDLLSEEDGGQGRMFELVGTLGFCVRIAACRLR